MICGELHTSNFLNSQDIMNGIFQNCISKCKKLCMKDPFSQILLRTYYLQSIEACVRQTRIRRRELVAIWFIITASTTKNTFDNTYKAIVKYTVTLLVVGNTDTCSVITG